MPLSDPSKTYICRTVSQGFTLLELLLVVAILAILSGVVMMSFQGGLRSDAKTTTARFEMEQLRRALINYQRDNVVFPNRSSAADLGFLFEPGASTSLWNQDYQLGWRGPYMTSGDKGVVDIGDNIQLDGTGAPHIVDSTARTLQRAIPDPFVLRPVFNGSSVAANPACSENSANTRCLFDWRFIGSADSESPHTQFGRPYLVFDLEDVTKARIVSMGANGIFESVATGCAAGGDDLLLCLY